MFSKLYCILRTWNRMSQCEYWMDEVRTEGREGGRRLGGKRASSLGHRAGEGLSSAFVNGGPDQAPTEPPPPPP